MNRRNFLKTAGQLTAGSMLMSAGIEAFTQTRKEVRVGGRRVTVVDIHNHCDFLEVAPLIEGTSMADANLNRILGPERLAAMDAHGIDIAALSVSQVVYGTDIPHGWPDTLDLVVDSPTLSDAEKEAILGGNLVALLGLTVS